jgi:D-sedoheptulose 7-phosphate isomerase
MFVLGLSGLTGGKMNNMCDVIIKVPSENTQRIQEGHLAIEHIICELVELELYCN